jgi:NADH dehydrogenase [ubiquinone] 1 alpha subcomplex assembly factor 7
MNSLEKVILSQIEQHGPMEIGQFMSLALGHPEYGYYMKQDPFGRSGDFVTAPEVSQMFGEVLGAWTAHSWMQMGSPDSFVLLECGPGRGTLMADVMRATKNVPVFHDACQLHLLEMSPVLRDVQGKTLADYTPQWHNVLDEVPQGLPIIVLANEFLDALPFRQLVYLEGAWHERVVGVLGDQLAFVTKPCPKALWPQFGAPQADDVFEFSTARISFVEQLCQRMKADQGAALFIDYGHGKSAFGDTFQAMKGHEYVSVLEDVGNADLTSHVDFEPLLTLAAAQDVKAEPLMEQGAFLKMLGIEARATYLRDKGAENIEKDLHRLIDPDEMGSLFKVMDMRYGF